MDGSYGQRNSRPKLALDLDDGHCQVALGSGFGLTARSPRALARATVAFNF